MRNRKLNATYKPVLQPPKPTGPGKSWNLYALDHLDAELIGLKNAAELIRQMIFNEHLRQNEREEAWRKSATGRDWFNRYTYLNRLLDAIQEMIFLNSNCGGGYPANYLSRLPKNIEKKPMAGKINLIHDLVTQYLFHVQQEDSNTDVLTIKLEIHGFGVSRWKHYRNQIVELAAMAPIRHFVDNNLIVADQPEALPPPIVVDVVEQVGRIRGKIMKLEREHNGMRARLKKIGRLIAKEHNGLLASLDERSKWEWEKDLYFFNFLINTIKEIPRVDIKTKSPGYGKYTLSLPGTLTNKFIREKCSFIIRWLDDFREKVLEINEDIEMDKLSEIPRYQGFYEKWVEFKAQILLIPGVIEVEQALIESDNQVGSDSFDQFLAKRKKFLQEIVEPYKRTIFDTASGSSGIFIQNSYRRRNKK